MRDFRAPIAKYNNRLIFDRFKYAEEAAHKLDADGRVWLMYRDVDRIDIDHYPDGSSDTYTVSQYVVVWNE